MKSMKLFAMVGVVSVGMLMAGCLTIFIGEPKKPEPKNPEVMNVNVNHFHYLIVVKDRNTMDPAFQYNHKKTRGHAGQVPDEFMNADHRKQRGRTAPN